MFFMAVVNYQSQCRHRHRRIKENFESSNVIYCCHKKAVARMDKPPGIGIESKSTQRDSGLETCPLILPLAPEVRAQDARGECEVTPRYLRLGCCHPVSRPGGDKARFPDESGSASQPWCQSNLPTRLETNLPPVPLSASTREEEVGEVCKVQVFECPPSSAS